MKGLESANTADLFIDIGQSSLQAMQGGDVFAFPLERGENGRLTDLCRERLTLSLRGFLSKKGRTASRTALCAIGARGVSIRRLNLPASSEAELQRVLRLQIETEFPLPPSELAWGSRPVGPPQAQANGGSARQELLVVAVKKEVLEEYAGVLAACGIVPSFTLVALARAELHPPLFGSYAVLDVGRTHSELTCFDHGAPASIRILAWGGETVTRAIQEKLRVTHDEAEKIKMTLDEPGVASGAQGLLLKNAVESALAALAASLKSASLGEKLYLTGKGARDRRMAPLLADILGGTISCESLQQPPGTGPSDAITGLKKSSGKNSAYPPLLLALNGGRAEVRRASPVIWKWATAAVLLALGVIMFPYAEAIVLKPFLQRKLAALEVDRGRLATIDQELDFLKFLKQNEPPYLDVIYLLARSSPQGTRLEELSMSRQRQISLRLKMANSQQVSDFRSKLIDSGWFGNVVVEEQAPSPDQRMSVRMTAELKPLESRKQITPEPPGRKPNREIVFIPPFEPMMPPPQTAAMPAEAAPVMAPAPPPDGPNNRPSPIRRRIRMQPTPQP